MLVRTIILSLILVLVVLMLTNAPLKIIRKTIDTQYGKSYSKIRFEVNEDNDDDDDEEESESVTSKASAEVERYKRLIEARRIEERKSFATWPRLENFFDEWKNVSEHDRGNEKRALQYERTLNAETHTQKENCKKCLIFIHGGGLIAGSPTKYNSFNWITTIAWFVGKYALYTDLLTLKYSLSPEAESPQALRDCINEINSYLVKQDKLIEEITLIGFSAGAFLTLQIALTWEYFTKLRDSATSIFGITRQEFYGQNEKTKKIIEESLERIRKGETIVSVNLCASFVRFDRLFMNGHVDVSHLLETYMKVYSKDYETDDPLFNCVKLKLTLDYVHRINIFDVYKNSLSNHALTLDAYLRHAWFKRNDRNDVISKRGRARKDVIIFKDEDFRLDENLLNIIRTGDLKENGNRIHKFVRNIEIYEPTKKRELIDNVHYHFFPFIVPTNAAWKCLKKIIIDTVSVKNEKE